MSIDLGLEDAPDEECPFKKCIDGYIAMDAEVYDTFDPFQKAMADLLVACRDMGDPVGGVMFTMVVGVFAAGKKAQLLEVLVDMLGTIPTRLNPERN